MAKIAWSFGSTSVLALLLFFFLIAPARAPHGGRERLGGRTIASQQEEEFDRQLSRLGLCYGISFNPGAATFERRRVCKALVVHRLQLALERTGSHLKDPIEFQCENTVFGKPNLDTSAVTVMLKPNAEIEAMDEVLSREVEVSPVSESAHRAATEACEFLTDCRWATRPDHFSFRKLAACARTPNLTHRKILLDEVASLVFGVKAGPGRALYGQVLKAE